MAGLMRRLFEVLLVLSYQNYGIDDQIKDSTGKGYKGEWFTTTDVLCLMTDIFGESATKDQVNGVFKREKKWFKSEHIDGNNKLVRRKLLNEAKTFAQSLGIENVSE